MRLALTAALSLSLVAVLCTAGIGEERPVDFIRFVSPTAADDVEILIVYRAGLVLDKAEQRGAALAAASLLVNGPRKAAFAQALPLMCYRHNVTVSPDYVSLEFALQRSSLELFLRNLLPVLADRTVDKADIEWLAQGLPSTVRIGISPTASLLFPDNAVFKSLGNGSVPLATSASATEAFSNRLLIPANCVVYYRAAKRDASLEERLRESFSPSGFSAEFPDSSLPGIAWTDRGLLAWGEAKGRTVVRIRDASDPVAYSLAWRISAGLGEAGIAPDFLSYGGAIYCFAKSGTTGVSLKNFEDDIVTANALGVFSSLRAQSGPIGTNSRDVGLAVALAGMRPIDVSDASRLFGAVEEMDLTAAPIPSEGLSLDSEGSFTARIVGESGNRSRLVLFVEGGMLGNTPLSSDLLAELVLDWPCDKPLSKGALRNAMGLQVISRPLLLTGVLPWPSIAAVELVFAAECTGAAVRWAKRALSETAKADFRSSADASEFSVVREAMWGRSAGEQPVRCPIRALSGMAMIFSDPKKAISTGSPVEIQRPSWPLTMARFEGELNRFSGCIASMPDVAGYQAPLTAILARIRGILSETRNYRTPIANAHTTPFGSIIVVGGYTAEAGQGISSLDLVRKYVQSLVEQGIDDRELLALNSILRSEMESAPGEVDRLWWSLLFGPREAFPLPPDPRLDRISLGVALSRFIEPAIFPAAAKNQ